MNIGEICEKLGIELDKLEGEEIGDVEGKFTWKLHLEGKISTILVNSFEKLGLNKLMYRDKCIYVKCERIDNTNYKIMTLTYDIDWDKKSTTSNKGKLIKILVSSEIGGTANMTIQEFIDFRDLEEMGKRISQLEENNEKFASKILKNDEELEVICTKYVKLGCQIHNKKEKLINISK